MLAVALYSFFRWRELTARWASESEELHTKTAEVNQLEEILKAKSEELGKYAHIPDVIEKSKRLRDEITNKINEANKQSAEIIKKGQEDARNLHRKEIEDAEDHLEQVREETEILIKEVQKRRIDIIYEAEQKAIEKTRKLISESIDKRDNMIYKAEEKAKELLNSSISFCKELRQKAVTEAKLIAAEAYQAKDQYDYYEKAAQAMKNIIEGYGDAYMNHMSSMLDDWSDEFAYDKAAASLRGARERTKLMIKIRQAAVSDYVEVGRKEFASNFVLDAFNGKFESIIARLKPGKYNTLVQEIKDAYILVNVNGKGFRNTRITNEYLDSRLDELKWANAVQELKIRQQEEQRAIREQIRDGQKAKREIERALKQARKEEEKVEKALAQARREFELAATDQKAKYLTKIQELEDKLSETEGYIRRTQSLAEQTKQGHVYIISNIGSFGENVYKIGLTRRLNYMERVNELGDASVPFRFDIHAAIWSEDAPALEYALHKKFLNYQINKVNRRKEFFRVNIADIQSIVSEMNLAVAWTLKADAADYYESIRIDKQIASDPDFRKKWTDEQLKNQFENAFDEDEANEEINLIDVV